MKSWLNGVWGAALVTVVLAQVEAGTLFDTGHLHARLRQVYFNEDGRSQANRMDRREWVQAVLLDYESGYFMDRLGFDLSLATAVSLNRNEMQGDTGGQQPARCKPTNLPLNGSDPERCQSNDIAGVQQAALKYRILSGDQYLNAYYGKRKRGYKTYSDSGSRALPAASYGFDLAAGITGLDLYLAEITAFSPRNQSYFKDDLSNGAGERIDYLRLVGGTLTLPSEVSVSAELNRSQDYLEQQFVEVRWPLALAEEIELNLTARYGRQKEKGDLYAAPGHEARFYDLIGELDLGALGIRAGMTRVSRGAWDTESFAEDHGQWTSLASNHRDFNAEDERTWLLGLDYDFAELGFEGLTLDLYYARGEDARQAGAELGDEWERGTVLAYRFAGALDGLDLQWENYTNRGRSGASAEDSNRLYLNYRFALF